MLSPPLPPLPPAACEEEEAAGVEALLADEEDIDDVAAEDDVAEAVFWASAPEAATRRANGASENFILVTATARTKRKG